MARTILGEFLSFIPGFRTIDGNDLKNMAEYMFKAESGITAAAGGGQDNATELTAALNEVATVATAADSVKLPVAIPGRSVFVSNMGAESLQVFGQATETISATNSVTQAATATGVAQASGYGAWYVCSVLGQWKQVLSA